MRQKYLIMFLMGLLYLVSSGDLFSQQCFKVSYDKNGNRISLVTTSCSQYVRGETDNVDAVREKEHEKSLDDLFVYPNPNNGIFRIKATESYGEAEIQIYDNKGILVSSCPFEEGEDVNISDKPSGLYLIRVTNGECVKSMIVLKL